MNGLFITIEGPDGAGKTSILNELYPLLKEVAKTEIIQTREPGGIPIAEEIRAVSTVLLLIKVQADASALPRLLG